MNNSTDSLQIVTTSQVRGFLSRWIGRRIDYSDGFCKEVFRNGRHLRSIRAVSDARHVKAGDTLVEVNMGIATAPISDEVATRDGYKVAYEGAILVGVYEPTTVAIAHMQQIDPLQRVVDSVRAALRREVGRYRYDDVTDIGLCMIAENSMGVRRSLETVTGLVEMTLFPQYGVGIINVEYMILHPDPRRIAELEDANRVHRELEKLREDEEIELARLNQRINLEQAKLRMEKESYTPQEDVDNSISYEDREFADSFARYRQGTKQDGRIPSQDMPPDQSGTRSSTRIFISHSHADQTFCRDLVSRLRSLGADVWYDEHDLETGELTERIGRELKMRSIFLPVLSKSALSSRWVKKECHWAFNLYERDETRVILPVTVAPLDKNDFDDWLFLEEFRRIEMPGMQPYPPSEAIYRVLRALKIGEGISATVAESLVSPESVADLIAQGRVAFSRGQFVDALVPLLIATAREPSNVSGWVVLAATHRSLQQYQYSLAAYEKALSLDPNNITASMGKGYVLADLRRYEQAIEAYDRVLEVAPELPEAWYAKSAILSALGHEQEADYALKRARELEGLEQQENTLLPPSPKDGTVHGSV